MSVKISGALSADGVIAYHREQYVSSYERYYSESGEAKGQWFGKEADAFGLQPGSAVEKEYFERLAYGQDPHSGLQLIEWRRAEPQQTPQWVKDDAAWRAHLEQLVTRAVEDGREVLREHAGGEKLQPEKQAIAPPDPVERSERELVLLEMHAIARQIFAENLAAESGTGARCYLRKRGIRSETAQAFGVGLADGSGKQLVEKLRHYGPDLMQASGLFVQRGAEFHDRFRGRLIFPIENAAAETIGFAGGNHRVQN